ncbi:COMM domain-containing protein 10 [Patella vulgata]|uniref:COMM domain-containing protein 10 n=1 Tax=Patella vulgata TaxID=6465 RepID=UPI00217FA6DA|nr:COMM domain-containing protein 10 [Patella vulgata]
MAALMFTVTPSIQKAVSLINNIEKSKISLLLTRILSKLYIVESRPFTDEEEEKLQGALGVSSEELELVLQTLEFFVQQAAYHSAKPQVLSSQLKELQIDDDKVECIAEVWTNGAYGVINRLKSKGLACKKLEDINWRLNLQLAQSTKVKLKAPNTLLELALKSDDDESKERIRLDFSHEELYQFYKQLETIQQQLDTLFK